VSASTSTSAVHATLLQADLAKLQLESRSGSKDKEAAGKELEGLRWEGRGECSEGAATLSVGVAGESTNGWLQRPLPLHLLPPSTSSPSLYLYSLPRFLWSLPLLSLLKRHPSAAGARRWSWKPS
jgi:hypothetical protein